MKKLFLVGALALFGAMNAQVKFGVNAGLLSGFAKLKSPEINTSDSSTGFYVGVFTEIKAGDNIKIQPALNYANIDDSTALQLPIMIKYYVDSKFNLQLGPQFLFDLSETPAELDNYYNKTNVGLAIGAAYDITNNLFAETRYSFQLNNHFKNAPSGYSLKANYFNLGIGYKF